MLPADSSHFRTNYHLRSTIRELDFLSYCAMHCWRRELPPVSVLCLRHVCVGKSERSREFTESGREAEVLAVVDRAGDHRHRVSVQSLVQHGKQVTRRTDSVPSGTKALGIGHEIGVGE